MAVLSFMASPLSDEVLAGRVVGAVDAAVAVQAGLVDELVGIGRELMSVVVFARVARRDMAALAQERGFVVSM